MCIRDSVDTGSWSTKAMKEAKLFGDVVEIASSKEKNFNYIPKDYKISDDFDYAHITTNNTIYGTQFHKIPESPCPLFSDMSSDIFSRNLNFNEFDLIYAGAQKNIGPAGATLVVLKKEILESICRTVPSMLNYKIHFDKDSMFNTPPVFSVYACMLSLKWLEKKGGIEVVENLNRKKSEILYSEIDSDDVFSGFANVDDRSIMNVTFNLNDEKYTLTAYENLDYLDVEGYENYLFLPFLDQTNGYETYGGGRYIDLYQYDNDSILIDFNRAYNPQCVYDENFSCPIVPRENLLNFRVEAGVKNFISSY